MRLSSRRLNVTWLARADGLRTGVPPPRDWLGSISPEPNVIRRLLLFASPDDRAADNARQGVPTLDNWPKNAQKHQRTITNSLNIPTITPNFRQSLVTLDWDKDRVASRPGPVRAPDSSAPQPPGVRSAGPVEFRVRFNPLMPSGRL